MAGTIRDASEAEPTPKNGSVVGRRDFKELNDQLYMFQKKFSDIVVEMIDNDCLDISAIPNLLKGQVIQEQTFIEYAKEVYERREQSLSPGTKKHYKLLFKFLEDWGKIVHFADVTEQNITKMDEYLAGKGLKTCSRWNYHKRIMMFIQKAMDEGLLKYNPYSKLDIKRGRESGLTRYLTPAEFHAIENCKLPTESLCRVRDLFVFQTYTMLGYSDMEAFDYNKCTRVKGQTIYKSKRVKTGQDFVVVLLPPALAILKKYNNELPIISNVKYNEYLKIVAQAAGIEKPVSTHWARHTGATLFLNEGNIPMHIVQHILGHATIRETEKTYAMVFDTTIVESVKKYKKKKFA